MNIVAPILTRRSSRRTYRTAGLIAGLICLSLAVLFTAAVAATVPGDFATIQAAINAVVNSQLADGTVINIQPGTYAEALLINQTAKSMTLRASGGPGTAVVDGAGKGTSTLRVLSATGNIRIEGLRLRNGQSSDSGNGGGLTFQDSSPTVVNCTVENNGSTINGGGGILTRSNAAFDGCVFQNNTAGQFAGGLLISQGARPTFTNCIIQGNTSGTATNIGNGGGVHVSDASPTFISSRILNNHGKLAGGGIFAIAAFGSPNGEATLTLEGSIVSGNTVAVGPDGIAEGGGLHVEDFAVGIVRRTTVSGNSAISGGGVTAHRARWVIEESIFENNTAAGGFGGGASGQSNNVVTPLQRAASIMVKNSVFRNNIAFAGGAVAIGGDQVCGGTCSSNSSATKATLQISDSILDGNTGNGPGGGAIIVGRANFTMTNSLVSRNQATGANGFGGGLWIIDATVATLTDVRIARNTTSGFGGGTFADTDANLSIATSAFHNNTSPAGNGGGLFIGQQGVTTGSVTNTVFVDNAGTDIVESCPSTGSAPYLTHTNTKFGTTGTVYATQCAPPGSPGVRDLAGFEALPKASGSGTIAQADVQARALFLAAPQDSPSVLGWSVIRATSVTISPGQTFTTNPQTGTTDVSVATNTTYTINANTPLGALNPALTITVLGPPVRFGAPGDVPVPADYDGDHKTDLAVYRPSTGDWFIFGSNTGFFTINFGAPASSGLGDIPVPADYDGDGKADVAIYRQSTGDWFVFGSTRGFFSTNFGAPASSGLGDTPIPADFDGDGKADVAIYRKATGDWFIFGTARGFFSTNFGAPASSGLGDTPVPSDFDGDHTADLVLYRKATGDWFIFGSTRGFFSTNFGAPASSGLGDIPVPADYDGDGKADLAIRRSANSTWFILRSSLGFLQQAWGTPTDLPAVGDFNGDGKSQIGVWRPNDGSWLVLP